MKTVFLLIKYDRARACFLPVKRFRDRIERSYSIRKLVFSACFFTNPNFIEFSSNSISLNRGCISRSGYFFWLGHEKKNLMEIRRK